MKEKIAASSELEQGKFSTEMPRDCPPDHATPASGKVYRVVKSDPPEAEDFKTWVESGKQAKNKECECHGISVFLKLEDAESYSDKYPYLGEFLASANFQTHHGKLAPTPRLIGGVENSHNTWWPFVGIQRQDLFSIVGEE